MSTFSTRHCFSAEYATAPEPWAASSASKLWPAVAQTKLPRCAANRSAIARALSRRIASPVRMIAPVSMSCGRQARVLVGGVDETAERLLVDAFATGAIGCQMNRRQVKRVAFGDDKAAREFSAEPAQHQLRKNNLRGCRADVDADARKRDRVELPQRMFFLGVEFVRS